MEVGFLNKEQSDDEATAGCYRSIARVVMMYY